MALLDVALEFHIIAKLLRAQFTFVQELACMLSCVLPEVVSAMFRNILFFLAYLTGIPFRDASLFMGGGTGNNENRYNSRKSPFFRLIFLEHTY